MAGRGSRTVSECEAAHQADAVTGVMACGAAACLVRLAALMETERRLETHRSRCSL